MEVLFYHEASALFLPTKAHPYFKISCNQKHTYFFHTNWLKVHSRGVKKYIFAKKCIWISIWIFQYCFYYTFTVYCCAIFYSLNTEFFNTIRVSNSLDLDQTRHFIGPDLGPNCLQRLSADNKSCPWRAKSLIQNNLLILKPWLKFISFGSTFPFA